MIGLREHVLRNDGVREQQELKTTALKDATSSPDHNAIPMTWINTDPRRLPIAVSWKGKAFHAGEESI